MCHPADDKKEITQLIGQVADRIDGAAQGEVLVMGRPKSITRMKRLIGEQTDRVLSITTRLAEVEERLAGLSDDDPLRGPVARLVGARRGQVENAESKGERLKNELARELKLRAARAMLLEGSARTD